MNWHSWQVRLTLTEQPTRGCSIPLGPEILGDGTAREYITVRATSRAHALDKALARYPNACEAEIVEELGP